MTSNPRIQCTNCGRWYRVLDKDGNQLVFPAFDYTKQPYTEDWEIPGQHCVKCIEKLTPTN